MEFAFELRIPEIEELLQARKLWWGIHVLPDDRLEECRKIRQMIMDFRRNEAVIPDGKLDSLYVGPFRFAVVGTLEDRIGAKVSTNY